MIILKKSKPKTIIVCETEKGLLSVTAETNADQSFNQEKRMMSVCSCSVVGRIDERWMDRWMEVVGIQKHKERVLWA
jgi:hypothetical protein